MATSKTRYRGMNMYGGKANVSPWFDSMTELSTWLNESRAEWTKHRIMIAKGSAIRATKASDERKGGHTHPPGATRCRVCGV